MKLPRARAKVGIITMFITCPQCDEGFTAPSGSLGWDVAEIPEDAQLVPWFCTNCNGECRLPRKIDL